MSANLISWPFRLAPNGSVVTRPNNSVEYHAEEIAQLVVTREGERVLVPGFGLSDPTYAFVDPQELAIKVDKYGIPVRIIDVTTRQLTESDQQAVVQFVPLDNGAEAVRINANDVEF